MTEHWTARHAKPVIFVILALIGVGAYLALQIPVAVFPSTNFPRIVVGIDNGVVKVRLKGACAGCPMSQMTMANFVEAELKKAVPGVKKVQAV